MIEKALTMTGFNRRLAHSVLTGFLTKLTWNLAEGNIQKPKRMTIVKEAAYNPLVVHTEDGGRKRDVYVLKKDLEQFEQLSESSDTDDDV